CFAVGSKDSSTWVFGAERWANLIYYSLGGHKDSIIACFFEEKSLDIYTLSQDATLCVWQCNTETEALQPRLPKNKADGDQSEELGVQNADVIHGKVESEQERIGKVKYSRVGK
ncbi:hypothetical protein scyTo_0026750, partial [Scyliorhinus torazame]|nr:hypothetical protein [Scyliorhinus torazame]